MFWLLIGGASLFALIVAGVLMAMRGGDDPDLQVVGPTASPPGAGAIQAEASPPNGSPRSEAGFLAEAEPLARKFLEAGRIEDLLPLVRNPGVAEARMRRHYPEGEIEAPGMAEFNTQSAISRLGTITALKVRTRGYEEQSLAFIDTPQGLKIDWESWVGWSEMRWEEFLASKPTTGRVFRLNLSPADYYNFAFSDDQKWQAYRLQSPAGEHSIYGYAERDSMLASRLVVPPESKQMALMLALKFPANATSDNQVLIEKFVAEGWVQETESSP
jgi:hypothetical protein